MADEDAREEAREEARARNAARLANATRSMDTRAWRRKDASDGWTPGKVFESYAESATRGEFHLTRDVSTEGGDVLRRTYFHGGIDWRAVPVCVRRRMGFGLEEEETCVRLGVGGGPVEARPRVGFDGGGVERGGFEGRRMTFSFRAVSSPSGACLKRDGTCIHRRCFAYFSAYISHSGHLLSTAYCKQSQRLRSAA